MDIISLAIAGCSLILSAYIFLSRNNRENTTELTTVIVKLESIGSGIADIKAEIALMKNDQKEDHDKLTRMEASIKTAWRQIDKLTGNSREERNEE